MDRQVIPLDEGEVLVDVARLGMVSMYFRTDDGRIGAVRGTPGSWRWEVFTDSNDIALAQELFEALDKQVRVGFFELPNALPEGS
jgi:hypothetical protein